jgi:hypothetical protein
MTTRYRNRSIARRHHLEIDQGAAQLPVRALVAAQRGLI